MQEYKENEYKDDEYEDEDEWLKFRGEALEYAHNKQEALVKKWLDNIGYTKRYKEPIGYYLNYLHQTMEIYAFRPAVLVGVEGVHLAELKKMLSEEYNGKWNVKFIEVRGGFITV